jgi:hypothetical protein
MRPSANILPTVPFSPALTAQQLAEVVEQQGWNGKLLQHFPPAQLLSRQGVLLALKGVPFSAFKTTTTRLCDDKNWYAKHFGARVGQRPQGSVNKLFWGLLGLLRSELEVGITARVQSKERVAMVMRDYVMGVAHVGNMLAQMYNELRMWELQIVQQLPQPRGQGQRDGSSRRRMCWWLT